MDKPRAHRVVRIPIETMKEAKEACARLNEKLKELQYRMAWDKPRLVRPIYCWWRRRQRKNQGAS